jgi:hypothetical protein
VAGIFGALTLALGGVMLADVLIHPEGAKAAGNAIDQILKTTFGAMLGQAGV